MPLILDAFNVLYAWRTGPARNTLSDVRALGMLTRRPPFGREPAVLVCDGPSPDPDLSTIDLGDGVEARFAGPGRDADSVIEALIAASHAPGRLTVVSSDRRIEKAARRRGCRIMSAEEFIGLVLRPSHPPLPGSETDPPELDPSEIAEWMKRFGVQAPESPPTTPGHRSRPSQTDRVNPPPDREPIDPADLDMERWLREYPPPKPGMDRGPGSD